MLNYDNTTTADSERHVQFSHTIVTSCLNVVLQTWQYLINLCINLYIHSTFIYIFIYSENKVITIQIYCKILIYCFFHISNVLSSYSSPKWRPVKFYHLSNSDISDRLMYTFKNCAFVILTCHMQRFVLRKGIMVQHFKQTPNDVLFESLSFLQNTKRG